MIKVALPNKGQLFEPTLELLTACGYRAGKSQRSLMALDAENEVEFYFLRPGDIPHYVASGTLDAGITGMDFVAEKGVNPTCLLPLGFGASRLCLAVPAAMPDPTLEEWKKLRIATSFPRIVSQHFQGHDKLVELEGAVEISIQLGIADAIVDIVETGSTLVQAGLRITGEPLFRSQAALFAHPGRENQSALLILKSRLEGRLLAQTYMMVEYDAPESILEKVCAITPGFESPTVTALRKPGWFAVKSLIRKQESQKLMDELAKVGAKGILLSPLSSVRM
jgi:ATP phosphoribosyltransferase